jgi:hypothetical protein
MIEGGDPNILTSNTIEDTKSRTYNKYYPNKYIPRSLFYNLKRLLESTGYDNNKAEKGVFNIVDLT